VVSIPYFDGIDAASVAAHWSSGILGRRDGGMNKSPQVANPLSRHLRISPTTLQALRLHGAAMATIIEQFFFSVVMLVIGRHLRRGMAGASYARSRSMLCV
jgi:hypothetical protein